MDKAKLTAISKEDKQLSALCVMTLALASWGYLGFIAYPWLVDHFPKLIIIPRFSFLMLGGLLTLPTVIGFKKNSLLLAKKELQRNAPQEFFDDLLKMNHLSGEKKNQFYRDLLFK